MLAEEPKYIIEANNLKINSEVTYSPEGARGGDMICCKHKNEIHVCRRAKKRGRGEFVGGGRTRTTRGERGAGRAGASCRRCSRRNSGISGCPFRDRVPFVSYHTMCLCIAKKGYAAEMKN